MRLDISTEARKLARRINGLDKRGRGVKCSRKVVMWLDEQPVTFGIESRSAEYYMKHKPARIVGVYDIGVSVEQLADDLSTFL